ncbi:hypothetical protein Tco_1309334 [Tanacetum coccineum]
MLTIQAEEGERSGHPSKPQPPPSTAQPTTEEPIPNVVSSSHQKTQTPRQALNHVIELPHTSEPMPNVPEEAVYEEWDDRVERAATTAASLDAEQASGGSPRCQEAMGGSITQTRSERVPTQSYDSPLLRVHTLGSDEGSMTLLELMVLCTTLSKKVESFQARRGAKIVVLDNEEDLEDSSKQGRMIEEIDQDARVTLVTPTPKENVHTYTRRRRAVSTGSGGISTASRLFNTAEESVSTAGPSMTVSIAGMVQEVNISIPSPVIVKDKGKGKMEESEDEQSKRTKLQQEQERFGHKATVRLQEELDEEEIQRMARVHEAAQYFTEEEWENIRARVKDDEELSRRLQAEERNKEGVSELADGSSQATITDYAKVGSSKRATEVELDHEGSKKQKTNEASGSVQEQPEKEEKELSQEDLEQIMMKIIRVGNHTEAYQFFEDMLKVFDRDDLVMQWNLVKERFTLTKPTDDKERALWVELKRLFEPNTDDTLWKL